MRQMLIMGVQMAVLGACAIGPPVKTPAEMILGTWSCQATSKGVTTEASVTYLAGGKATMDARLGVVQGGMAIKLEGKGEASWSFLPDGRIEEKITSLTVIKGAIGDQTVPVAMLQPVVDQAVVNQAQVSKTDITASTMISTDDDGVVTRCTR